MLYKLLLLFVMFASVQAFAGEKITICHIPPGNPDNPQTLSVSENAYRGHFDNNGVSHHGDYLGPCVPKSVSATFYPCNVGITHESSFNETSSSHDYITYSYKNLSNNNVKNSQVLEAPANSYAKAFGRRAAFGKRLLDVRVNLSSELMGTKYFIDFCFDGRSSRNEKNFSIDDLTHFSKNPFPVRVSNQLFCDIYSTSDGQADLSTISLAGGLPIQFSKVPEFCVVRFNVNETNSGDTRNWSRSFNRMSAFIEATINGEYIGSTDND